MKSQAVYLRSIGILVSWNAVDVSFGYTQVFYKQVIVVSREDAKDHRIKRQDFILEAALIVCRIYELTSEVTVV